MKNFLPQKNNAGYTLLFAVLFSSLVLSIGLSILNISQKETILSSSGIDSQQSFFAADTGIECARYWDSDGVMEPQISCSGNGTINTNSYDIINPSPYPGTKGYSFAFNLTPNDETSPCVVVSIRKEFADGFGGETTAGGGDDEEIETGVRYITTIESRGYNMGNSAANPPCFSSYSRQTERAIRVRY